MKPAVAAVILFFLCGTLSAEPRFASCFGDAAVLQQGSGTTVWGFDANPAKSYSLRFGTLTSEIAVKNDGTWSSILPNLNPSSEEQDLVLLESGEAVATISNIVVGEVWLAAGQSNMQMQVKAMMKDMPPATQWADSASFPQVRFRRINDPVLEDRGAQAVDLASSEPWIKVTTDSVVNFSATAAVFAREIAGRLKSPVGIIDVSWGGKPIEPFIPREAFNSTHLSQIKALADSGNLEALQEMWGGVIIRNPEGYPGAIFNARIAPLTRYRLAGFLWYQAESNAGKGEDPRAYRSKMAALAAGWRGRWNDRSLPLHFVQLPSFPKATGWIRMREEQRLALRIPDSSMAVTIDIRGEGIHPPDKLEVGKRLARSALHCTYQMEEIAASGPRYAGHKVSGSEVIVTFTELHGGLASGNRPLFSEVQLSDSPEVNWFELAGADGQWHEAKAHIVGDTVRVRSDLEPAPVAVRYACHTNPQGANLYNRAGLPASPFCSDLKMLKWDDPGKAKPPLVMKSSTLLKAPPGQCRETWLKPDQLVQWLCASAVREGKEFTITSPVPNVSGRHHLTQQSDHLLVFDWFMEGHRTTLRLEFEAADEDTLLTLTHTCPTPLPENLLFPPGKHYGDEVWAFSLRNLRHFLSNGKRAMTIPDPFQPEQIDLEIVIDASSGKVWEYLTSIEKLKYASLVMEAAKIEPGVGGRYSFGWTEEEGERIDGPGFITKWDEGTELAVSWYGGNDSIVSWRLEPRGATGTRVTFRHTGLTFSAADGLSYQFGWAEFLMEMKENLEAGD